MLYFAAGVATGLMVGFVLGLASNTTATALTASRDMRRACYQALVDQANRHHPASAVYARLWEAAQIVISTGDAVGKLTPNANRLQSRE